MNPKVIKYYITFLVIFFSWVSFVSAGVIINEVQIAPTEERFIELYNNGGSSVDLTDWYLQRKTATGTSFGSLVSKTSFAGKIIGAGEYFLISKGSMSGADIEISSLTLTESNTIQLKNSSQEVVSKVGWGDANDCDGGCAPNPTSAKSIQRIPSGDWVVASRTPGSENNNSENDNGEYEDDDSENSENTDTSDDEKTPAILKITTKIISPKIVVARTPFSFNSLTTTNRGETYAVGKWIWNFGDGMTSQVNETGPFSYIYEYPGEYALTLSYFDNNFTLVPDATDKIIIKVIESEVYISAVGNSVDPYIEIENKSKYEVDLSGWVVTAGIKYFKIPDGTILLPDKKIKLSPKITGFTSLDLASIVVTNPNKFVIATYPVRIKQFKVNRINATGTTPESDKVYINNETPENPPSDDSGVINLNDLGASASGAKINISKTVYSLVGLLLIIGLGVTSFLLIKKKNNTPDYMEKQIRAEDMTIIE